MTAGEPFRCPQCGTACLTLGSADYCPACLLRAALSDEGEPCPYQVLAPMAEDARGVTYLAQPLGPPNAYLALKVFGLCDDVGGVIARYRRWRPALERLRHPSIGRLVDVGATADGRLYVATDYIPGRLLTTPGVGTAMGAEGRAAIASQLTEALGAAHAAGLVHLKLDASKIRVSAAPEPRATMIGLGLALVVEGADGDPDVDRRALAGILAAL
jgi:serine/threonine protein kinase